MSISGILLLILCLTFDMLFGVWFVPRLIYSNWSPLKLCIAFVSGLVIAVALPLIVLALFT
jgi:hypothetical protein